MKVKTDFNKYLIFYFRFLKNQQNELVHLIKMLMLSEIKKISSLNYLQVGINFLIF